VACRRLQRATIRLSITLLERKQLLRRVTSTFAVASLLMLAGPLLAGCQSAGEIQARLGRACQFRECTCTGPAEGSWLLLARASKELMWTETGEATCPDGFHLVLLEDKTRSAGLGKPKTGIYYEMERRQKSKRSGW